MPVNTSGKWKVEVKKQQDKRLSVYAPFLGQWTGFLGRNDGVVQNPNYPSGYVFVRDNNGILMTMWNQKVPNDQPGLPIVYGYTSDEPKLLQVISQWTSYAQQPTLNIPHHSHTHEFNSGDMIPVHGEQILPWLVTPTPASSPAWTPFSIDIYPGLDRVGTDWVFSSGTTIDLASHVPAAGARFVVVCFDNTGAFTVVDGTPVATPEILTGADVPAETTGTVVKAIVRLYAGQGSIRWTPGYTDIFDDRFLVGFGGSGSQVIYRGTWSSTVEYTAGQTVVYSGTYYLCVLANINNAPPNTTYWVAIGVSGSMPGNMFWTGAWNNSANYVINDVVLLGSTAYICILGNTNQTPPNLTYWNPLGNTGNLNWRGNWDSLTAYIANDVVFESGGSYVCILANTGNVPPNITYWNPLVTTSAVTDIVAKVAPTGSDQTVTSIADLTGETLTFNQVSGHLYEYVFSTYLEKSTTATLTVVLTNSSNAVICSRSISITNGYGQSPVFGFIETASGSGSVTRKLRASVDSGSALLYRSGTQLPYFYVRDLGI
jgi:hypothetical protein